MKILYPIAAVLAFALMACVQPGVRPSASDPVAPDPSGVYFHAWSGSTAGTEWALVHRVETGDFRLTDVFGNGFRFSVEEDGAMTVHDEGQGASGQGAFLAGGEARFDWRNWGMHFSSRIWRAPLTEADFPVLITRTTPGDERLAGRWGARIAELTPTTGRELGLRSTSAVLTVDGSTLRIDWEDGSFDQGLFIEPERLVFRVLSNAPAGPYATPAGCSTSRPEDVIGLGRLRGETIDLELLLQTRAKVGQQVQSLLRCELRREQRDTAASAE